MTIGFIGLGNIGMPMARRLLSAGQEVMAFDTRGEALAALVADGAEPGESAKHVGDCVETVFASLPSPQASLDVATGAGGVIEGGRVKRFVDLSTVGRRMAERIHDILAGRGIAHIDSPVSGGVGGAENGTLAVMVSGPHAHVDVIESLLETIGRPFRLGEIPGSAQTMKLANNLLSATALVATAEAVAMGVKSGLDARVMIEVFNAGSGANSATRDKFPRSVLPRTFDYGFATGLMVKDLRLLMAEAQELGLPMEVAAAVGRLWEIAVDQEGAESDFTAVVKPIESAAAVVIGGSSG